MTLVEELEMKKPLTTELKKMYHLMTNDVSFEDNIERALFFFTTLLFDEDKSDELFDFVYPFITKTTWFKLSIMFSVSLTFENDEDIINEICVFCGGEEVYNKLVELNS